MVDGVVCTAVPVHRQRVCGWLPTDFRAAANAKHAAPWALVACETCASIGMLCVVSVLGVGREGWKMDKAELRPLVLEVLRREGQTHLHAIDHEIRRLAPEYQRHDILMLQEIIWELLLQGVLAPGKNSLNLNLPFVHVTEYGARCLEEDALVLHDPDGYLERLEQHVSDPLDEVVRESVRESLLAFLAGRFIAAAAMLGMAAERCLDLVIVAYLEAVADPARKHAFEGALKGAAGIQDRFDIVKKELVALSLPKELRDALDPLWSGLSGLVRYTRDDAGHPVVRAVDRSTVHANLLLYPQYCKQVYELIGHLGTNRP